MANALRERVQIQSFFWSVFSRIPTEYGEILRSDGNEETDKTAIESNQNN